METKDLKDKHRGWPNAVRSREDLDAALAAGEASGMSDLSLEEIHERTMARLKANGDL